jgi:hypothetical protein
LFTVNRCSHLAIGINIVLLTLFSRHAAIHVVEGCVFVLGPVRMFLSDGRPARVCKRRPFVGTLSMLLHVLLQISFLSVTFATVLANVRFEVFALLVLGDVLQKRRLVNETLVARVTLVRFVGLMAPRVAL